MKKILSMLLAFTIACTNFSGISNFNPISAEVVHADDEVATIDKDDVFISGSFTYKVTSNDDRKLVVTSYNGDSSTVAITSPITFTKGYYDSDGKFLSATDDSTGTYMGDGLSYTVTAIDAGIFSNLANDVKQAITTITIPNSVISIGSSPFSGCDGLETITFAGDAPTVTGSGTIDTVLGQSATIKYSSNTTTNTKWATFIDTYKPGNSVYINDKATATLSVSINDTTPAFNEILTVSTNPIVDLEGDNYTIQWYLDGKEISGENGTTYTVKDTDDGYPIKVGVTVKNDYTYKAGEYTSSNTSNVTDGKVVLPTLTLSPSSPKVGEAMTLSTSSGNEPLNGLTDIIWYHSDDTNKTSLDTSTSYTPVNTDINKEIKVEVTVPDTNLTYIAGVYDVTSGTIADNKGTLPTLDFVYTDDLIIGKDITVTAMDTTNNVNVLDGAAGCTIQWVRVDSSTGNEENVGTNSITYTLLDDDYDHKIKVYVTIDDNNNDYNNTTTNKTTTTTVSDGKDPFPEIQLDITKPYFGDTITVSSKDEGVTLDSYGIKWYVNGVETSTTGTTFKVDDKDYSGIIKVEVTVPSTDLTYSRTTKTATTSAINKAEVDFEILVNGETASVAQTNDKLSVNVQNQEIATIAELPNTEYEVTWYVGDYSVDGSYVGTDGILTVPDEYSGEIITAKIVVDGNSDYAGDNNTLISTIQILENLPKLQFNTTSPRAGESITVSFTGEDAPALTEKDFDIVWVIDNVDTLKSGTTITIDSNLKGKTISARVTAKTNTTYNEFSVSTEDFTILAPQLPTPIITITDENGDTALDDDGNEVTIDKIKVGHYLTVSVKDDKGDPIDLTSGYDIQWYKGKDAPTVVGNQLYQLVTMSDEDDDGVTTVATGITYKLVAADEDYYITVSVTPESDDTYATEPIYSAWTEYPVGDESGRTVLSGLTIDYSEDGTKLVITSPSGVEFTSADYTFDWWRMNATTPDPDGSSGDNKLSQTTPYLNIYVDDYKNKSYYVVVTPKDGNEYYKDTPAISNAVKILPSLPSLTITIGEEVLDTENENVIEIGSKLTVAFTDTLDIFDDFYIEWLVGGEEKSQGINSSTNDLTTFTVLEEYTGKEISVKVYNNYPGNSVTANPDYNTVPATSEVGTVETRTYTLDYDLGSLLKLTTAADEKNLSYGDKLEFTLSLKEGTDTSKYSLPINTDGFYITMGGKKYTGFTYDHLTGKVTIGSVTGNVYVDVEAYTKDPDSGENVPTIYLKDMTGVYSTKYTLSSSDIITQSNKEFYEFHLFAPDYYVTENVKDDDGNVLTNEDGSNKTQEVLYEGVLPDTIDITFGATVAMTILDGYLYYKDTGKVLIETSRFGTSALGFYATITGKWVDEDDNEIDNPNGDAEDYEAYESFEVIIKASDESGTEKSIEPIDNTDSPEKVSAGDIITIELTPKTNFKTPITIKSIKINGTTTSSSNYSINGTTLTINSGVITGKSTIVIDAVATDSSTNYYEVTYYEGSNKTTTEIGGKLVLGGDDYSLTIKADDGYSLPSSIIVTMKDAYGEAQTLTAGSDYAYSTSTGKITIPNVSGDLVITVPDAVAAVYYDVAHNLTNVSLVSGTGAGSGVVLDGGSYTATFAVTNALVHYPITSNDVSVTVGGVDWSSNTTFDESTGKLTVNNVSGNVLVTISATDTIPSSHTLYFNFSYLYCDIVDESKDYKFTLNNGESQSFILKVKSDYVGEKYLPASVTVVNSRTGDTLVAGTDYTYSISSDGYATLSLKTVTDSLKITATAGSTEADTDTDSDSGSGDSGSGDSGDSDSDSDDSTASTYDITFVDSSGNTVTTLTTSTSKTLSYLPTITTTSSTVFLGWYTSSSGGTQITTSTVFTSSRSVYARVYTVFTPTYNSNGNHVISTSNSNIAIHADSLTGGTITVNSNYVSNFVIVSPYSGYTTTASTTINLPDSNGNTVSWTIPAGVQIDSTNHLNLAISVSESAINTNTSLGRSLGYVDFAHSGALTANNQTLYVTFRNYNVTTGDTVQLFKLNDYNEMTGEYVGATALGNYYVRAGMLSCSRWEIIARNYTYSPDNGGYYTQYFNIPTTGYIEELRNVQIDQVLDLTKINLGNGLIIEGWYYDQNFTNKVSNPSYVVVTAAIIKTGLYPKTYTEYVTPENGNPWPDSSNGYLPNLTDTPVTDTKLLTQLF